MELAEVGGDAGKTACSATPGMQEVFAALELLGAELTQAGSPIGDGVLLQD